MNKKISLLLTVMFIASGIGMASAETLNLVTKDSTWKETSAGHVTLIYNPSGNVFNYNVSGTVPLSSTSYSLIYYKDVASPPTTTPGIIGKIIATSTSTDTGSIAMSGNSDIGPIPQSGDANSPGAKIWLIPSSEITAEGSSPKWSSGVYPANYLFEANQRDSTGAEMIGTSQLITYTKADVNTENPGLTTGVTVPPTTPEPIVSISINTASLNFGSIRPGETSSSIFGIKNTGNVNAKVELRDDGMTGAAGHAIAPNTIVFNPPSPVSINVGNTQTEIASLTIPTGTAPDTYTGTVSFTASAAP